MRVLLRKEIRLRVSGRYSHQIHKTWGYNRLLVRTNFKREARKASLMWTHRSYFYCVWRRWRGGSGLWEDRENRFTILSLRSLVWGPWNTGGTGKTLLWYTTVAHIRSLRSPRSLSPLLTRVDPLLAPKKKEKKRRKVRQLSWRTSSKKTWFFSLEKKRPIIFSG